MRGRARSLARLDAAALGNFGANVAKARGIAEMAKASGLGRESLYKALAPGAKVRYETVRKVLDSLGVKLKVAA
jgi:probable addiction module antidote protein